MLWIVLALTNGITFVLMGVDKLKARRGAWRIPERTLFLFAALFGALGGVLGMQLFRHKTKHLKFKLGFPALLVIQGAVLALYMLR